VLDYALSRTGFLVCTCRNTSQGDGFAPCDPYGTPVDPEVDGWSGVTFMCIQCGEMGEVRS
jgi:hypothetical protein